MTFHCAWLPWRGPRSAVGYQEGKLTSDGNIRTSKLHVQKMWPYPLNDWRDLVHSTRNNRGMLLWNKDLGNRIRSLPLPLRHVRSAEPTGESWQWTIGIYSKTVQCDQFSWSFWLSMEKSTESIKNSASDSFNGRILVWTWNNRNKQKIFLKLGLTVTGKIYEMAHILATTNSTGRNLCWKYVRFNEAPLEQSWTVHWSIFVKNPKPGRYQNS